MDLSELTAYAKDKYGISELHKWSDFPGFSVLCHPKTGKWAALLIRQWDTEAGREIQHCDLRCGLPDASDKSLPFLSGPVRMKGKMWVGISFDETTRPAVVFRLFDKAIASGEPRAFTIVLDSKPPQFGKAWPDTPLPSSGNEDRDSAPPSGKTWPDTPLPSSGNENRDSASPKAIWQDTPLPFAASRPRPEKPPVPERIRAMRRLYEYGRTSNEVKAENFIRQGKFMEDFEDDYPWEEDFFCYYPTYHEMTTRQLRGYFSWRAKARKGEFGPLSASAAYIYIFELINGIGADSPAERVEKLKAFEEGFLNTGIGDPQIRPNLRRWMLDLAIVGNLPVETARAYADPALLSWDQALSVLKNPADASDEAVFSALFELAGRKPDASPVLTADSVRGYHLFAGAWRTAAASLRQRNKDLFTLCFGTQPVRIWQPFAKAVYLWKCKQNDFIYHLNDCRFFSLQNGVWTLQAYEKLYFDKERLKGFLHETDLLLRRYLKTGRYLKEKPANAWAAPYIEQVIEADRKAAIEAARPKISLDLTGLDKIRQDALSTQESLLVPDDMDLQKDNASADNQGLQVYPAKEPAHGNLSQPAKDPAHENLSQPAKEPAHGNLSLPAKDPAHAPEKQLSPAASPRNLKPESRQASFAAPAPDLPLDELHLQILRALLSGESPDPIIRTNHLMPSIVADTVNEALFDEIGDTVLICEDNTLSLMEDYIEDLTDLLENQL